MGQGGAQQPPAAEQTQDPYQQQADQYEAQADQMQNEAKVEKARANMQKAQKDILKGRNDYQQAVQETQQLQQELQGGGMNGKAASVLRPELRLKYASSQLKKYADSRVCLADESAMAEVMLGQIPSQYFKGASGADPLDETPPWLTAWCLAIGGGGKFAKTVNDRLHARAQRIPVKTAAESLEVLRRGMDLHRGILKSAAVVKNRMTKTAEDGGESISQFLVRNAVDRVLDSQTQLKMAHAIEQDRWWRQRLQPFNQVKSAACGAMPVGGLEQALAALGQLLGHGGPEAEEMEQEDPASTPPPEEVAEQDPADEPEELSDEDAAVRIILIKHPEARKTANIRAFCKAGGEALANNDPDNLARAIVGLAAEGAMGPDAVRAVTGE
jgi:hypothetical protein